MATKRACPNCGTEISGYDKSRDDRMRELGMCVDCLEDKNAADMKHWRCAKCRQRRAIKRQRKRLGSETFAGHVHRPRAGWK